MRVVIAIAGVADLTDKLTHLDTSDYDRILTRTQLQRRLAQTESAEAIELAATNGRAAGEILAVVRSGEAYLLSIRASHTSPGPMGTTVTLNGVYKH